MPVLRNLSSSHLFWKGQDPTPLAGMHEPTFLAFPRDPAEDIGAAAKRLETILAEHADNGTDEDPLAKAGQVLGTETMRSFWNHGQSRDVVRVSAKRPYWVPDVSDALWWDHGFYTCEHDIPYIERALADLGARDGIWTWDTAGKTERLEVMTYDIETTQYGTGAKDIPIDIIGWSTFDVDYAASKDLESEKFDFRFEDLPTDWQSHDVEQLVAEDRDQELDHLKTFTQRVVQSDIISGHNVMGFDNKQIHDRIKEALQQDRRHESLEPSMRDWFVEFTSTYSKHDRSFHFGSAQDIAVWYPSTLDTYHAARKFYFFHDDFTLKGLAPWLGIDVADREYMEPADMKLDARTLRYNKHDVQEQMGVTQILLAQALPMAFTVNLPMDALLTGGNTKMWDHMALLRARRDNVIMPATCRAQGIARAIHRILPERAMPSRQEIADAVQALPEDERAAGAQKEFLRVVKQGPEMPFWVETPTTLIVPGTSETGYAIAGGMTLKPDSELKSHFVPWYHVVEADVGAMYPTLLKARNLTADTVVPARTDQVPDDWIWLRKLDETFIQSGRFHVREADVARESYTRGKGWMIGVMHRQEDGLVNKAMTGILDTIQKVKDERAAAKAAGKDKDQIRILDMTYASLKAARNAGTHGILVASNVSCRQFNVWGGANITTIGQRILQETLEDFEAKGIRVVYGDTDGIYLGCSRSIGNLPALAAAVGSEEAPVESQWITFPDDAIEAIQHANKKWREELEYEGFELEAEQSDAMVFVVHKNYLKFSAKDGFHMDTKGNNFKGSDKAPLARRLLGDVMQQALCEVGTWDDEEDARERMKTAIKRATKDVMGTLKVSETPWADIVLRQQVQPLRSYKANPDGTLSSFAVRTAALEQVIGEPITASRKFKFIICKEPLPLYRDPTAQREAQERLARQGFQLVVKKPKKSGIKPIEFMWPAEQVEANMVDWTWYKDMVENYVKGAFGFDSLELAVQRDLSSWF